MICCVHIVRKWMESRETAHDGMVCHTGARGGSQVLISLEILRQLCSLMRDGWA